MSYCDTENISGDAFDHNMSGTSVDLMSYLCADGDGDGDSTSPAGGDVVGFALDEPALIKTSNTHHEEKTDEKKLAIVKQWVHDVYVRQGLQVPPAIPAEEVDELYEMAIASAWQRHQTELMAEDALCRAREYMSETGRMRGLLEEAGVGVGMSLSEYLSASGRAHMAALVDLANELELRDTRVSTYLAALSALQLRLEDQGDKLEAVRADSKKLLGQTRDAIAELNELRKTQIRVEDDDSVRRPLLAEKERERTYFKGKRHEYREAIVGLKAQIDRSTVNARTTHQAILSGAAELERVNQSAAVVHEQLQAYEDLPPDVALAQLKIEEAKQKLESLEVSLSNAIHKMNSY